MATFDLNEEQQEMIYLALRGDKNQSTLQRTKILLEKQRLGHAVQEVQADIRILEGTGVDAPGLLRMFNPQHDLLANGAEKPTAKGQNDTRDMFDEPDASGGDALDDGTPRAPARDPIVWADDVPSPRPSFEDVITEPSGNTLRLADVVGYDTERQAFRVVSDGGWDTFVFAYGLRDRVQWRVLASSLDYDDASDPTMQPQGSPAVLGEYLRSEATSLLDTPPNADAARFLALADAYLPVLDALAADTIAPTYLREHVTGELAGSSENVHALARLMLQYADVADARAANEDTEATLRASIADDLDDDEPDATTEQALADGSFESEPAHGGDLEAGTLGGAEIVGHDNVAQAASPEPEHPTPGARTVNPSKQRARNSAHNGVKTTTANPRPKAVGKAAKKAAAKKGKR